MLDASHLFQWDELAHGRHQRQRGDLRNIRTEWLRLADLDAIVALSFPELRNDLSAERNPDALRDFPGRHPEARSGHPIDAHLELWNAARLFHAQVCDAVPSVEMAAIC